MKLKGGYKDCIKLHETRPGCTVQFIRYQVLDAWDRMRTDAISESMIQVLYCLAINYIHVGVIHVRTGCNTHYIVKQPYSTLHHITLHNNIGLVSSIEIWCPFSFNHYTSSTCLAKKAKLSSWIASVI